MTVPDAGTGQDRTERLAALRAELDAIDDGLHAALRHRADLVRALSRSGAKAGVAIRPGREASILRRLAARDPAMAQTTVRIWRELFAGSTAMQGALSVAVCCEDGSLAAVTREQFGALTPLRVHRTPALALAEISRGTATIAVLPVPTEHELLRGAWWLALLQKDQPRIAIIGKLPFWAARPEGAPRAPGFVVAAVPPGQCGPDPSGDDRGLLGIELRRDVSRSALSAAMTQAGFDVSGMLVRRDPAVSVAHAMAEVAGLVHDDDPRLAALRAVADRPVVVLGGYATPMDISL